MSEKLYALLLRLYPARFRRQYGEEAMLLFRERLRDERGAVARLRLWLDLLLDAGSSLPREYRRGAPALNAAPVAPAGLPLFQTIEPKLPKPGSFLGGTLMAFVAVGGLGFLLNHAGRVRHYAVYYSAPQAQGSGPQNSETLPTGDGPGGAGSPSSSAGLGSPGQISAQPADQQSAQPSPPQPQPAPALQLDAATRQRILAAVRITLRQSYPDHRMAERIAASLSASEDRGGYEALSNANAFADAITRQMRAVSGDSGLVLYFVAALLPKTPAAGPIHWVDAHFLLRVPQALPSSRPVASKSTSL